MSVNESGHCLYRDDDETLRLYAAGALAPEAAEAFEEHLFSCDRCDGDLRTALEIRAAMPAAATVADAAPRRRPRTMYSLLAVAATALLVTLGLWQSRTPQPPLHDPTRGVEARPIVAGGTVADSAFHVHWEPRAHARQYLVQFFAEDGTPLQSLRTSATAASIPLSDSMAVRSFYWNVQALDADGVVIDRSELQKVVRSESR